MSDGDRVLNVRLTEAQWDVLNAAFDDVMESWFKMGDLRNRDRHTLNRAYEQLSKAWIAGIRR